VKISIVKWVAFFVVGAFVAGFCDGVGFKEDIGTLIGVVAAIGAFTAITSLQKKNQEQQAQDAYRPYVNQPYQNGGPQNYAPPHWNAPQCGTRPAESFEANRAHDRQGGGS
jgi:hypothetical protein